jgi:serine/threonine protein kinase
VGRPERRCIGENTIAQIVEEGLDAPGLDAAGIEEHVAECSACLGAVELALRSSHAPTLAAADETPEPRPDLTAGTTVGRYVIVEKLGSGGMGTVYSARDPALGRRVALKLLRVDLSLRGETTQLRARLLREAQAMAKLSHPDVVTVYDVGTHEDQLFIAMELVLGGTLRQWCRAGARSWREVAAAYARAGRGLAAAHAAGLVHRDFKPDNVLIGVDQRVRVTDFGLARGLQESEGSTAEMPTSSAERASPLRALAGALTRSGAILGTPAYMAPEQLRGQAADPRSDVFSFCVSLYEGLYGVRPYAGRNILELLAAIDAQAITPPLAAQVPARIRRALLLGLRASPAERHGSLDPILEALDRALAGSSRRGRWRAASAVVAGLGVAAGLAIWVRPRPQPAPVAVPSGVPQEPAPPATASVAVEAPAAMTAPSSSEDRPAPRPPRSMPRGARPAAPAQPSSAPFAEAEPAPPGPASSASAAPTVGKNGAWIIP